MSHFLLVAGLKYRQVGSHMWNDHSSRSHSMLTVYLDIETVRPSAPGAGCHRPFTRTSAKPCQNRYRATSFSGPFRVWWKNRKGPENEVGYREGTWDRRDRTSKRTSRSVPPHHSSCGCSCSQVLTRILSFQTIPRALAASIRTQLPARFGKGQLVLSAPQSPDKTQFIIDARKALRLTETSSLLFGNPVRRARNGH